MFFQNDCVTASHQQVAEHNKTNVTYLSLGGARSDSADCPTR
jgi:hypothetical protein